MQQKKITVIGAGFSGLVAAHALQSQGFQVQLVDKGYGIGGRLASRNLRSDTAILGQFDYGLQAFAISDDRFLDFIQPLIALGVIVPWRQEFPGINQTQRVQYYRGKDSNRAIANHLAKDLQIHNQTRIVRLSWDNQQWQIWDANDQRFESDVILLTAPIPQALDLFEQSSIPLSAPTQKKLETIKYAPCFSLMVVLEHPVNVPVAIGLDDPVLKWIACNHQKGISPQGYAVTLLAQPEFSQKHWETETETAIALMLEAAQPWLGDNIGISHIKAQRLHRWKYSHPLTVMGQRTLQLETPGPLVMAGDAFSDRPAPNIFLTLEQAFLSGTAAAKLIANSQA